MACQCPYSIFWHFVTPICWEEVGYEVKIWQSQTTAANYKIFYWRMESNTAATNLWLKMHGVSNFLTNSVSTNTPPVFLDSEKHEVKIWQSQTTAAKYKGVLHQCAFESPKHSFLSSTSVPHNVSHLAQDHMFATPHNWLKYFLKSIFLICLLLWRSS